MKLKLRLTLVVVFLFLSCPLTVKADPETFVYDDKGKQDPFLRLVSSTGAIINFEGELLISDMVLEGIIAGQDGNNVAIINGIIVKPNDQLGPYVVKNVQSDTVVLEKDQERFVLKLRREE
jgi:hypothetical protein